MIIEMIMPQMGESVVEGTITKWLKAPGERIEEKETLLEISTDKVDSEIPAPKSGILIEILTTEGTTVPVGTKIALIDTEGVAGQTSQSQTASSAKTPTPSATTKPSKPAEPAKTPNVESDRFYSPLVKNIAKTENISMEILDSLEGSGAEGRITKKDILAYVEQQKLLKETQSIARKSVPVESDSEQEDIATILDMDTTTLKTIKQNDQVSRSTSDQVIEMDHIRRKIAEHMVASKKISPHVNTIAEADMTSTVKYRESVKESFKKSEGVGLTYTAFFIQAVAKAIRDFPKINCSVDGTKIILKANINIGMAVALPDGNLIVPVIKNADKLNLIGLAHTIADLTERARSKKLKPDDIAGGTFTVTNMGTFGSLFGTPIINQPQVAILGIGAIKKRVMVTEEDAIAIRSMVYLTHTYDHRIVDGSLGGMFLERVVQYLEAFRA